MSNIDYSAITQIKVKDENGEPKTKTEIALLELWNLYGYEWVANEAAAEYVALVQRAETAEAELAIVRAALDVAIDMYPNLERVFEKQATTAEELAAQPEQVE